MRAHFFICVEGFPHFRLLNRERKFRNGQDRSPRFVGGTL